jgi:hypothetical protein
MKQSHSCIYHHVVFVCVSYHHTAVSIRIGFIWLKIVPSVGALKMVMNLQVSERPAAGCGLPLYERCCVELINL